MTTRQRIDLLARAHPRLFSRADLLRLVRSQLGHVDALDRWIFTSGGKTRTRGHAPKIIYHICAGNLAVSAWTSLAHGLLLGANNVVKLPGDREDSSTRKEILAFIHRLPAPLRRLVATHRELDPGVMARADVIVAFGSDATMNALRAQTRWDQKFIAHGHAVSLLWLAHPNRITARQARACAVDVLTYDQLGCLSPQAIYAPEKMDIEFVGAQLARALELEWRSLAQEPTRTLSVSARIVEARDLAQALGHRLWLPPRHHLGWTLIHDPDSAFQPSPLHGVIHLRMVKEPALTRSLASVTGRISTVGVVGRISSPLESAFIKLGVSRFCPAGRMQFPPLTWHHDGQSPLRDMVTWLDSEHHR